METIVGVFDHTREALRLVEDLDENDISRAQITVIAGDPEGVHAKAVEAYAEALDSDAAEDSIDRARSRGVAKGTAAGGIVGALAGALLGVVSSIVIPGAGAVVIGGALAGGAFGAGSGAVTGGLAGLIPEANIGKADAAYYAEAVRRGALLVAVDAETEQVDEVVRLMLRHNLVDLDRRVDQWRAEGWQGLPPSATTNRQ